jgi:hypothetical protein
VDGDGRLVGILSRDAILRFVEVRRGLGLDEPPPIPRSTPTLTPSDQLPPAEPHPPTNLPATT